MTHTPVPPPGPPITPPAPLPPPVLPPGTPVGRPRIWQAIVLFLAFGGLAGGSCAAFLSRPSGGASEMWSLVFAASLPLGAGAFALLVFRLWRRRLAESWPTLGQAALMLGAGTGLAVGGCGGWAVTMEAFAPIALPLGAAFIAGLALSVGAVELFFVALARLILSPRK